MLYKPLIKGVLMDRIDYSSKVDPWVKKNPKGRYVEFVAANPKVGISTWSFTKRRAKVLGLPLTPSMASGYRSRANAPKVPGEDDGMFVDRRTRSVYTTVYSVPKGDLVTKNGIEAASEIISAMNRIFKLHLESAQVEIIGTGIQNFEIRRYSK
jgi:hypothetical protein